MANIRRLLSKCLKLGVILTVFGLSAGVGIVGVVAWEVLYGNHEELQRSTILAKIKEETTLYYLDEKTRIGSIFESMHRKYVPIDDIPAPMINAIVAAEDKNFYEHVGIDPAAIGKAFVEGLMRGGRFRRGGSTITQQTVKNIIDDWEASFSRKFREMIKALQLERIYNKREILEFYLNQFHVAGNGNGVGIAARYYFNKDVRDLTLVESAFIAGSVKGPGKYNPFIKYTKKTRARAKFYANERKNYVLGRMYEQNWISQEEYDDAINSEIPFNKGEFRTAEVALVDLVRTQLKKPEVLEALGLTSPDELNIAGMRVFTTLDSELQNAAQLSMRRNLSRLETILSGFSTEPKNRYKPKRDLKENSFIYGKVEAVEGSNFKDYSIKLSFGMPTGVISNASLTRYAKLLNLAEGKGYRFYLEKLIKQIKPGDILFVQVTNYDKDQNHAVLELQKRPRISGGMIALDKGEVRAVISGFDTLGYNRAIHAKRQPGSVFKSLVFFAGLQLGWSILDRIDNIRQIFTYQGKFYYPRPDHTSPYKAPSMMWSGIMSENLSSVALGARLLEKLSFEQYKTLMDSMGLLPEPDELPRDYHYRVSREIGVSLDNLGLKKSQLSRAIEELAPDLIFAGQNDILAKLRQMWWGSAYVRESIAVRESGKEVPQKEIKIRLALLANNYVRMAALQDQLTIDWQTLQAAVESQGLEQAYSDPQLQEVFERFQVLVGDGMKPELGYNYILEKEKDAKLVDNIPLLEPLGRKLLITDVQAIWGHSNYYGLGKAADLSVEDVKIAGFLPNRLLARLRGVVDEKYQTALEPQDSFLLSRYYQHYDFRIGLGLRYLTALAKASGVQSDLEPVLSFPLGTSEVTASEVAKIYQTFVSGKTYRFYKDGPENQINFIRRIEDRFGNVLYEPDIQEFQLVKPEFALQMREILRKAVSHGTGRRARGELYINLNDAKAQRGKKIKKIRIDAFGKTGTTNRFTTSYFAGFIPRPVEYGAPLDPENNYVISSYVGYDYNRVMKRGRQRIYGGSGALPLWTDFAKQIISLKDYKSMLDPLDLKVLASREWGLKFDRERTNPLMVDLPRGLVIRTGTNKDIESWHATDIASTGEAYQTHQDLFALGSSVKSVVYVPSDPNSVTWQPLRVVEPFRRRESEDSYANGETMKLSRADSSIQNTDAEAMNEQNPESDPVESEQDVIIDQDQIDESEEDIW